MKKKSIWIEILFAIFFIGLPGVIGIFMFMPSAGAADHAIWFYWVTSLGFLLYSIIILTLFIIFKVLSLNAINYFIPIALVCIVVYLSFDLHIAIRIVLVVVMVFMTFPINMFTTWLIKKI